MHHLSSRLGVIAFTVCGILTLLRAETSKTGAPPDDWNGLKAEASTLGKSAWRPMLRTMADPFPHEPARSPDPFNH